MRHNLILFLPNEIQILYKLYKDIHNVFATEKRKTAILTFDEYME